MTEVAIRVETLSKQYRIGKRERYYALRDTLAGAMSAPFRGLSRLVNPRSAGNHPRSNNTIWALKDVSFEIKEGEVVGIIGRNGAGKSTLLKILSRITKPTEGTAEIHGRVGSLLEVGTGFHPELTGRENIYLNGAILGMRKAEIGRKFDEIVAFAEVEKFIDTPVKHYSSGMYMRLAFAVAAHLESDIMLVDEVLAVGDAAFQKKCLGKMGDVAKEGRTVLFVSHNMAAVENLCRRGIVLDQGEVACIGSQAEAITHYLSRLDLREHSLVSRPDRTGSGEVRITKIEFRDVAGNRLEAIRSGQDVGVYLHYETTRELQGTNVIASIIVKTQMDVPIFLHHNRLTGNLWNAIPARGAFVCQLRRVPLPPAVYRVGFSVMRHGEYLDRMSDAVEMVVTAGDFFGTGEVPPVAHGLCLVDGKWRLEDAGT